MSVQVQHRRDSNAVIETVTPVAGELGFDTTKKEPLIGDGASLGGVRLAKKNIGEILTPGQISANTNNYSTTGLAHARELRLSTDASRNLTGLVPLTVTDSTDGRLITLYNAGAFNLVVQDQNASSSAANRFDLGGADITLAPKQSLALRYANAISRWEIATNNFGQAVPDAGISARKLAASGAGGNIINGQLVWSNSGGALTVALKTLAGGDPSATDPVLIRVRDTAATTDADGFVTITAALSQVISSGSSLGASNGVPFKLWVVFINDGGTSRLGVYQSASIAAGAISVKGMAASGILSATSEGGAGAADSAQVFYTGAAVTAKPYTVLGSASYGSGLATAGSWVSNPTLEQMFTHRMPLPGERTGTLAYNEYTASSLLTVNTPADNTIPQNTEGTQILSVAITPSDPAHLVRINYQAEVTGGGADNITSALFVNSTANAIAAEIVNSTAVSIKVKTGLRRLLAPGTVSTQTYNLRVGGGATNVNLNGSSGSALLGGVSAATLEAEEIAT